MENFGKTNCRFCLEIVNDGSFKIIEGIVGEILDVLLLNVTTEGNDCVICNACSAKMFAAFQFKAFCMDTEDTIFPYLRAANVALVDLRDVYLKERGKEHLKDMLEDERICRLCMHVITCGFTSVEEVDIDRLCRYIPEINFRSTKEPVICKVCVESLDTHTSFLINFSDIKKETDSTIENLSSIKHEDVEIKSEENYSDTPMRDKPMGEYRFKRAKTTNNSILKGKRKRYGSKNKYRNSSESDLYDYKGTLNHQLKHKKQMHSCNSCDFKTVYKSYLPRHQLTHKDIPEVQMYKCDLCDFKTKYKYNVAQHQSIQHKNHSIKDMYKCDSCDFKTSNKYYLRKHQRKLIPEQMFKCDSCDFKTVFKSCLTQHQQKHKGQMYSCNSCDFKFVYKSYLTRHQLTHKDIPEVQMYKCDLCDFKTKYKSSLRKHLTMIHKDISDEDMHKCDSCSYKTKYKYNFKQHQLMKHKDIPEDDM